MLFRSIVDDTSGRHDALCGTTSTATNIAKYGTSGPHSSAPAGRELFTLAAAKHGLEPRDVAPSLSFFHGVTVESDGGLTSTGSAGPGKSVDLLIHLPVIVLLANTAHPLDPSPDYPTTTLDVLAWRAPEELSELANTEPEYQRAVQNTENAWKAAQ